MPVVSSAIKPWCQTLLTSRRLASSLKMSSSEQLSLPSPLDYAATVHGCAGLGARSRLISEGQARQTFLFPDVAGPRSFIFQPPAYRNRGFSFFVAEQRVLSPAQAVPNRPPWGIFRTLFPAAPKPSFGRENNWTLKKVPS